MKYYHPPVRYARWLAQLLLIALLISTPFLLFLVCRHVIPRIPSASEELSPEPTSVLTGIPTPTPTFDRFSMDVFRNEVTSNTISLHYTIANPKDYGISDVPVTLGTAPGKTSSSESSSDFSGDSHGDTLLDLYEQLISYPYDALTKEEQLTYDTLKRTLNLSLKTSGSPYFSEVLGPTTGFQAQLPILLAEYRFYTEEDVRTYLDLLPCIYDYFKGLADFEKEKSAAGYFINDKSAQDIIDQCLSFVQNPDDNFLISTFEEKLNALSLDTAKKTEYLLKNRTALFTYVLPAYELLAETLKDCLGTGKNPYGLCRYDGGKDYYETMLQSKTGSDKTVPELKQRLQAAVNSHTALLATAIAENTGVYEEYVSLTYPETEPGKIMEYLMNACASDFPSIDCKNYHIKYIPESLQDYVSPAMYLIPPMDDYESNTIYINPNPLYDADSLFPTVAHEGYPGHLYQNVAALSGNIHPLRYLLGPTGYDEGWATYVELYSYQYAVFSEALTSFLRSNQVVTLCLYSLSDILIHYDGYTPDELAAYLEGYGFSRAMSDFIYETMLAEPGAYLPYAVGYLEFEDAKERAKSLWGNEYSDYRFHEFLMELGPVPFSVLYQELEG
ncbi:MAG: DUF885 domain-containing protein [Lachnospiraceae bacterium]